MSEVKEKRKNILTSESEPVLKQLMEDFVAQGLTDKEKFYAYRDKGFDVKSIETIYRWKKKFGLTKPKSPLSNVIGNQRLEEIEDEIWKPIITSRFDASAYKISQYGNIIGKQGRKLKWCDMAGYASVKISLSYDDYFDGAFIPKSATRWNPLGNKAKTGKQVHQNIKPHQLVAEFFLPKPVPLCFSELWPTLNEKQKKWIQSVYIVDHIDDDGFNPHVDNLRWVTTYENNHRVKNERETGENAKLRSQIMSNREEIGVS